MKTKRNLNDIPLISFLEEHERPEAYRSLDNCIEVASYLALPYGCIEKGGVEVRYLAFHIVWWFDALEKILDDLCLDSEEVQMQFVSKDKLKYCIVVDTTSELEATKIVNVIPERVSKDMAIKIKNAEEKYDLSMVGEIEE